MKLETAQNYAAEIITATKPFVQHDLISIAGSIRRRRPEVGDIEILAVPKQGSISAFWSAIIYMNSATHDNWKPDTKVTAQSRYVRLTRNTEHGVLQLDVFLPHAFDWGRMLAIRTGPADYSARLASAWVRKGYRGTDAGLLPESDCIRKGEKWVVKPNTEPRPVRFETEASFYDWLRIPWVSPEKRF